MRTFHLSSRHMVVTNYRWTGRKGLECELFPSIWTKSDYNLKEFLAGMAGAYEEITAKHAVAVSQGA